VTDPSVAAEAGGAKDERWRRRGNKTFGTHHDREGRGAAEAPPPPGRARAAADEEDAAAEPAPSFADAFGCCGGFGVR